jgi:putative transposon-encoded protein
MKQRFVYEGYESIEKVIINGGNSGRVYVPKSWLGRRVRIILLDPLEE